MNTNNMRNNLDKIYTKIVAALGSRWMLAAIIGLFVLQSLWIAFSFRYPMIYDESFHVPMVQIFSHEIDPFISDQPRSYDTYGDLEYTSSILYHYVLSWPYRFLELFTQYEPYLVVALRVINIVIAAAGLYLFARLFAKVKIKQTHINAGLLVFTLLPIVPFVAAHVSYDNPLFLLTAAYLIFAVKIIQSKNIIWSDIAWLATLGCLAALIKFTFLPIFAASVIYLIVLMFRRHGKKFFEKIWASILKTPRTTLIVTSVALVITVGLFSVTYIRPLVQFGTPTPSCTVTMSEDRCMTGRKGYLIKRQQDAQATKESRPALNFSDYTKKWFDNMLSYTPSTLGSTVPNDVVVGAPVINTIKSLVFFGFFLGLGVLLYSWRSLKKNSSWYFLLFTSVVLFVAVFYTNMSNYYSTHQFFANQPRYLLSVAPIVVTMIVVATAYALRNFRWVKIGFFIGALLLFTQGGGVTTHILRSEDNWYWQDNRVIEANHKAKALLRPIVKEN